MSKWSNAACNALAAVSVLALTGCDEFFGNKSSQANAATTQSPLVTSPDTDVAETASAEPGRDRRQWRAQSANARTLTGNVTTSTEGRGGPLLLAYATGITITAEHDATMKGSAPISPGGPSFSEEMNLDRQADVYIYRVTDEQLSPSAARSGGLCGPDRTMHVAVSEFVGKEGEWTLRVASFKGSSPGADSNPQFCGAYLYSVQ